MDPNIYNKYGPFVTDVFGYNNEIPRIYKDGKGNYVKILPNVVSKKELSIDQIAKALMEIDYKYLDRTTLNIYYKNIVFIKDKYASDFDDRATQNRATKKSIYSRISDGYNQIFSPKDKLFQREFEVHNFITRLTPQKRLKTKKTSSSIEEKFRNLSSEEKNKIALQILYQIMSQNNIKLSDLNSDNITLYREKDALGNEGPIQAKVNFQSSKDSEISTQDVVRPSEISMKVGILLSELFTGKKYEVKKEGPKPENNILNYIIWGLTRDESHARLLLPTAIYLLENPASKVK